jgi:hypothetical protein
MKSLQFVSCIYINILGTWDSSLLFLSQILARNEMPWTVVFGVARRSTAVVSALSTSLFFSVFFSLYKTRDWKLEQHQRRFSIQNLKNDPAMTSFNHVLPVKRRTATDEKTAS